MADTLVIFCKTAQDAIKAAASMPRANDLNRFFVLFCEKPNPQEMSWIKPGDDYLALDRTQEWKKDTDIGIRAGILYTVGWWNLFFCVADKIPSNEDLSTVRTAMQSNGFSKGENIWGISREHILLYGLDGVLGKEEEIFVPDTTALDLEMAAGMRGEAVSAEAINIVFREVAPIQSVQIQGDLTTWDIDCKDIANRAIKGIKQGVATPSLILAYNDVSDDGLTHLFPRLAPSGVVAIVGKGSTKITHKPYKVLRCNNGVTIWLYGAKRS